MRHSRQRDSGTGGLCACKVLASFIIPPFRAKTGSTSNVAHRSRMGGGRFHLTLGRGFPGKGQVEFSFSRATDQSGSTHHVARAGHRFHQMQDYSIRLAIEMGIPLPGRDLPPLAGCLPWPSSGSGSREDFRDPGQILSRPNRPSNSPETSYRRLPHQSQLSRTSVPGWRIHAVSGG